MAKRPSIQVVGWLSAVCLLVAALYFANLTAYHVWAASFSTPNRAWHEDWANRSFGITGVLLAAAISVVVWLFWRRKTAATRAN